MNKKIVDYSNLHTIIPILTGTKVLVGGCFDILHVGHIRFLTAAKQQGDILIVALEGDDSIKKHKKREPFYPQKERAEILSTLTIVDSVIMLPFLANYNEYLQLVNLVKPAVVAVTEGDPYFADKERQIKSIGGKIVIVVERINGYNSSQMSQKTSPPLS